MFIPSQTALINNRISPELKLMILGIRFGNNGQVGGEGIHDGDQASDGSCVGIKCSGYR